MRAPRANLWTSVQCLEFGDGAIVFNEVFWPIWRRLVVGPRFMPQVGTEPKISGVVCGLSALVDLVNAAAPTVRWRSSAGPALEEH